MLAKEPLRPAPAFRCRALPALVFDAACFLRQARSKAATSKSNSSGVRLVNETNFLGLFLNCQPMSAFTHHNAISDKVYFSRAYMNWSITSLQRMVIKSNAADAQPLYNHQQPIL
jgi:hypothetical protein